MRIRPRAPDTPEEYNAADRHNAHYVCVNIIFTGRARRTSAPLTRRRAGCAQHPRWSRVLRARLQKPSLPLSLRPATPESALLFPGSPPPSPLALSRAVTIRAAVFPTRYAGERNAARTPMEFPPPPPPPALRARVSFIIIQTRMYITAAILTALPE